MNSIIVMEKLLKPLRELIKKADNCKSKDGLNKADLLGFIKLGDNAKKLLKDLAKELKADKTPKIEKCDICPLCADCLSRELGESLLCSMTLEELRDKQSERS